MTGRCATCGGVGCDCNQHSELVERVLRPLEWCIQYGAISRVRQEQCFDGIAALTNLEEQVDAMTEHFADAARRNQRLIEQVETLEERLRQTDEVLALYQDRDGEPGWISPVQKVIELKEQLETLRFAAIRAASQLPEAPETALDTLGEVLNPNPANRHFDGTAAQAAAYQRVHEHYASDPASEPKHISERWGPNR